MYDPEDWASISKLDDKALLGLPVSEDDRHEYKSSTIKDSELADKIGRAASGYWNSGGGLFVVGVDGQGKVDGGINLSVGRTSRRDWVDQVVARVSPRAQYAVHCIQDQGAGLAISPGNGVVLIAFAPSEIGPHMAPDNRYYIRAGAHTVPASHFLVEAIHARRGLRAPMLRHTLRRKPEYSGILQLGVICISDAPALHVELALDPLPKFLQVGYSLPIVVPVISRESPFYFDFHFLTLSDDPEPAFKLQLKYTDISARSYEATLDVDTAKQMGPNLGAMNTFRDIERAIEKVADAVKGSRDVERALDKIADAIKMRR